MEHHKIKITDAFSMNEYLSHFKDESGKSPDPFKLAFFVEDYCKQYIKDQSIEDLQWIKNS